LFMIQRVALQSINVGCTIFAINKKAER
jgi:hypothetical protein